LKSAYSLTAVIYHLGEILESLLHKPSVDGEFACTAEHWAVVSLDGPFLALDMFIDSGRLSPLSVYCCGVLEHDELR
jgi:hypothetical protein